jgi:hypothetical protein
MSLQGAAGDEAIFFRTKIASLATTLFLGVAEAFLLQFLCNLCATIQERQGFIIDTKDAEFHDAPFVAGLHADGRDVLLQVKQAKEGN